MKKVREMRNTRKIIGILLVLMLSLNVFLTTNWQVDAVNLQGSDNIRIDVEKRWIDKPENSMDAFAEIALFRNDEEVNRIRLTEGKWYHSFDTDSAGAVLPIYDGDGIKYEYTVKEVACTQGYGIIDKAEDISEEPYEFETPFYKKFTIQNHKLENKDIIIFVKKYWETSKPQATSMPTGGMFVNENALMDAGKPVPKPIPEAESINLEVTFKLYKNGQEINELTMKNSDFHLAHYVNYEAEANFTQDKEGNPLPFLENGEVINYEVKEFPVSGYIELGKYKSIVEKGSLFEFVNQLEPVAPRPKPLPKPIPDPKPKPIPEKPENTPDVGETTKIKVTKEWYLLPNPFGVIEDIDKEVTFYLYKYTTEKAINELTITNDQFDASGTASAVFTTDREGNPLPKMENGSEVDYIVLEFPKNQSYVQDSVNEEKIDKGRHFIFYNRNEKFTDDDSMQKIYVIKKWIGKRGIAKFNLFQQKQGQEKVKIDTMTLYGDSKDYKWDKLSLFERFDENDNPIEYFVEEEGIVGYESKMYEKGRVEVTDIPSIYFKFENVEKIIPDEPDKPKEPETNVPDKPEPNKPEPNKPEPKKPEPNKPEPNKPDPNSPEPKKPEPQDPKKPDPQDPKKPDPLTPYVPTPPTTPETEVPLEEPKIPEGEPSKPEKPEVPELPTTPDMPVTPTPTIPSEEPEPEPIPLGNPELPKTGGIPLGMMVASGLGMLVAGLLLKKKK